MQIPQDEIFSKTLSSSFSTLEATVTGSIPESSNEESISNGNSSLLSSSSSGLQSSSSSSGLGASASLDRNHPPPFIWPWLPWKLSHPHHHHHTLPKAICPTNYTSVNDDCVPQCDTDAMYTAQQKKIAEAMILSLSVLCFILTLFSLVTFWAEPTRFGYPERPILYLGLCYNLVSVCYLERIIFHYPAKESINEENNTCMLSPPCLASYITIGYLTLCAASWWLIFSLSFYLSSNKKWSSEALEKKSSLFHVLAWVSPLAPPIGALLWGAVKPHELTGMCTAPGFIEIPAITLLVTGIVFIEITSQSLKGLQQQMRINNNNIIRFSQIRKRLLIFSFMFFIPALSSMVLSFFERFEIHLPPCLSLETCNHPEKFSSIVSILKLFCHLISGSLTGMWVWSRKTCESYKNRIILTATGTTTTTSLSPSIRHHNSSILITKSLPKIKSSSSSSGNKQITPLYSGINFHNIPMYNGHSRV